MAGIAAELNLSRETVSAVFNGRAERIGVTEATARRVREHVARRGYVPSRQARQLRAAPKRVVGLLHLWGLYSHLGDAFNRLSKELAAAAPEMEIVVTSPERLEASVRELLARRVTDLVWIHNGENTELFRDPGLAGYLAHMRPIIYNFSFDSPLGEADLTARGFRLVGVNRTVHIRRLARFLHRLGHRTVVLPDVPFVLTRNRSYADIFEGAGLHVVDCLCPFDAANVLDTMRRQGVTAACFHGDSDACKAIRELGKRGVRIPEDLTVTGFDGTALSFNQDLTTLAIPVPEMVAKVCEIVSGTETGLRHCFDLELVKGCTHGPARGTPFY